MVQKLDISAIILTYNEELHIRRCLNNVKQLTNKIYIIDCFSTDKTVEIAKEFDVKIINHEWPGNQAEQLNWALKKLNLSTEWILRLDADEYLLPELVNEIKKRVPTLEKDVTGIIFKRRLIFMDKWIKRGAYPVKILRMFRNSKAVCEQRLMDEHILLLEGTSIEFDCDFVDHNLGNFGWWTNKHNNYSIRDAIELLDIEYDIIGNATHDNDKNLGESAVAQRMKKHKYAKMPLFWRSFFYFCLRYFVKGGFLEGKEGFLWHFLQGWWYRTLVDAKIFEVKRACGNDKSKIISYIKIKYNIELK